MSDDADPKNVMDAAHAAIAGVQTALGDLATDVAARLDRIIDTQAQTLEHVLKLQPIAAVQTEVAGTVDALSSDPGDIDPPPTAPNEPAHEDSPLRKLHNVLG